jgi:hypothetical protein
MSKELAKKENAMPVEMTGMMQEMMQETNVQSNDLLIPSLLLMQAGSDLVSEEKAVAGDYVNSVSNKTFGKSVMFQPFFYKSVWMVQKDIKSKDNFLGYEEVTSANINRERKQKHPEHGPVNYVYCMDFFGFINGDTSLPFKTRFKNTSLQAGKTLTTQMYGVNPKEGKLPHNTIFKLESKSESNEHGNFKVTVATVEKDASMDELKAGYEFWKLIKESQVKVDDIDSKPAESAPMSDTVDEETLY